MNALNPIIYWYTWKTDDSRHNWPQAVFSHIYNLWGSIATHGTLCQQRLLFVVFQQLQQTYYCRYHASSTLSLTILREASISIRLCSRVMDFETTLKLDEIPQNCAESSIKLFSNIWQIDLFGSIYSDDSEIALFFIWGIISWTASKLSV